MSAEYREVQLRELRIGYSRTVADAAAKKRWADDNKDLQRIYVMRSYYKRKGELERMPRITKQTVRVEIFWDGQGYWFSEPNRNERLGGPYETVHKAWKAADKAGYEVIDLLRSKGLRK